MKQKWIVLLMVMLLLSGCLAEKEVLPPLESRKGKIKILCSGDEKFFHLQYGSYFNIKYPDIELEVIGANKPVYEKQADGKMSVYDKKRR